MDDVRALAVADPLGGAGRAQHLHALVAGDQDPQLFVPLDPREIPDCLRRNSQAGEGYLVDLAGVVGIPREQGDRELHEPVIDDAPPPPEIFNAAIELRPFAIAALTGFGTWDPVRSSCRMTGMELSPGEV